MGLKKSIASKVAHALIGKAMSGKGALRKILVACLVMGLILTVALGFLVYGAFHLAGNLFASGLDQDLHGLKTLVTEKVIVLTQEQKSRMEAMLNELSAPDLTQEKKEQLRQQLLEMLEPGQQQDLQRWKDKAIEQTRALTAIPIVADFIEQAGMSIADITANIEAALVWLGILQPEDNAELIRQLLMGGREVAAVLRS